MEQETQPPRIIESYIFKLFLRYLKDNNLPLNISAFMFTFGRCADLIQVHMIPIYYIVELKGLDLFEDDNVETRNVSLKLKWIQLVKNNYYNVLVDSDRNLYINLINHKFKFNVESLKGIENRENRFKRYLSQIVCDDDDEF